MAELRWVLLGLGVLVVAGVYLWGRGVFRRSRLRKSLDRKQRTEPHISASLPFDEREQHEPPIETDGDSLQPAPAEAHADDSGDLGIAEGDEDVPSEPQTSQPPREPPPEKVVTIRFIPKAGEVGGEEVVLALRKAGLEHGRFGIFHCHDATQERNTQFSVASLTEPGSFDLTQLATSPIAGLSFFMVLPGVGDPVARFDAMVECARMLALELDAELFDDRGSSWSIQRERYVREEIIRYRHQLMQTEVVGNVRT